MFRAAIIKYRKSSDRLPGPARTAAAVWHGREVLRACGMCLRTRAPNLPPWNADYASIHREARDATFKSNNRQRWTTTLEGIFMRMGWKLFLLI